MRTESTFLRIACKNEVGIILRFVGIPLRIGGTRSPEYSAFPRIFVLHHIKPPKNLPNILLNAPLWILFNNQGIRTQRTVRQAIFFKKLQELRFIGKLDLQYGLKSRMPLQE